MSIPSKVLWGEGLFLRPQHFQRQDQYHEALLQQTADALHPYLWGVRQIEWGLDALRANRLRLNALSVRFHDGTLVDAPAGDALPAAIDLSTVPPEVQQITYHAALPALARDGGNAAAPDEAHGGRRYTQSHHATPDLYTQSAIADVSHLRPAVRLVSDQEPLGPYDSFPLIRLRRAVTGGFEPEPAFLPPALSLHASPRLRQLLSHLLDALEAKINALQGHMREPSRNVIEFRSGDVSSFWLLHTANHGMAVLMHYARHPGLHPERLFESLLGLAGSLMTFSKHYTLNSLPSYSHDDPGTCFLALDVIIRDLLDTVISAKYFAIALREDKPSYHIGKLDAGNIDAQTTLYLAIGAAMPALELVEIVPLRVKAGAPDDVAKCVLSAMPGVRISHAPQLPAAIPVRPDTCYFVLENRGVLYEQMLKAQSISVYVPAGIPDLRLELVAVTA